MKVVFFIPSLKKSGPIEVVYNIVKNLNKHDLFVVEITKSEDDANVNKFSKLGNTKIISLFETKSKLNLLKLRGRLKEELAQIKPDIIHSHGFFPDLFSAFFLKKYKRVATSHNNPYHDYSMKYQPLLAKLMIMLHFKAFKSMEKVVAISEYNNEVLSSKTDAILIYNGISEDIYKEELNKSVLQDLRRQFNLPENKSIILSVSSLIKRKNVGVILKAFSESNLPNTILVIAGDGNLKQEYQDEYDKNKAIHFLGHVGNVVNLLQISDVLVSVSKSEGFGLNVAEAASVGLPLILSDLEPYKEQFLPSQLEDKRITFLPLDEKLVENLKNELELKVNNFAGLKMNKLQNKFTGKYMAKEYEKVYEMLVSS